MNLFIPTLLILFPPFMVFCNDNTFDISVMVGGGYLSYLYIHTDRYG